MPNHHLLLLFPASNGPIIKKLLSASKFSLTLKPVFEALVVQILLIIKLRIAQMKSAGFFKSTAVDNEFNRFGKIF
jgi:hypothetical protein